MKIKVFEKELFLETVKLKGEFRYYVYVHYRLDNNTPFYVGRGCGYRATSFSGRSKKWHSILNEYGLYFKIIENKLSFQQSIDLEIKTIRKIGINNLCNVSFGGIEIAPGKNNYFYDKHLFGSDNGNYGNKFELNPLSIKVLCLDCNGNIIKEYVSIRETEIDGFSSQIVCKCCNGNRIQHKGFQFIYKSNYNQNNNYAFKRGITSKMNIECYDLDDNFIKSYSSIQSTALDGFAPKNVQQVLKGSKKTHLKHKFKYKTIQDIV
jgi:hypothetical protein